MSSRQEKTDAILAKVPKATSPLKAIRDKCLDCVCGYKPEVERCPCTDCSIWPYRFGYNPYSTSRARTLTVEQRAARAARLAEYRRRKAAQNGQN